MSSVSGLSEKHRHDAKVRAVEAATLALKNASSIHYTQGPARWEGIDKKLVASRGVFPHNADCSAFYAWCIWNGLFIPFGVRDTVNGQHWRAGYTGTMLGHGKRVYHEENIQWGDAAIYGSGAPGEHTAICVGNGMVISHGSERGPFLLPLHYRADLMQIRRYI